GSAATAGPARPGGLAHRRTPRCRDRRRDAVRLAGAPAALLQLQHGGLMTDQELKTPAADISGQAAPSAEPEPVQAVTNAEAADPTAGQAGFRHDRGRHGLIGPFSGRQLLGVFVAVLVVAVVFIVATAPLGQVGAVGPGDPKPTPYILSSPPPEGLQAGQA